MFSLPAYQLTALFFESFFYGLNSTSFAFCLYFLLRTSGRWRRSDEINMIMLIVGCILFSIASLDIFITFTRCLQAFIFYNGPGGPTAVFSDLGYWMTLATTFATLLQTVIGDGILIYRCWIVYSRSWRIVTVSILLWIGATVSMIFVIQIQATLNTSGTITTGKLKPPNRALWILSILQNIITTTLIVRRIRHVDCENSRLSSSNNSTAKTSDLRKVMRRIIESGLLYTISAIVTFITYACGSNSLYVASKVLKQIVAISFNLIIIRVSKSNRDEYTIASMDTVEVKLNHIPSSITIPDRYDTATAPVLLNLSRGISKECQENCTSPSFQSLIISPRNSEVNK
ncbi:hypothetical protein BDQ17DRAFT_1363377 [Cyathus striatus]|nr:hypothetical protein BDQ17DRAFT_1363377 [Cyathus striatus]